MFTPLPPFAEITLRAAALADVPDDQLSEPQRAARSRALDEYRAALAVVSDSPAAHEPFASPSEDLRFSPMRVDPRPRHPGRKATLRLFGAGASRLADWGQP